MRAALALRKGRLGMASKERVTILGFEENEARDGGSEGGGDGSIISSLPLYAGSLLLLVVVVVVAVVFVLTRTHVRPFQTLEYSTLNIRGTLETESKQSTEHSTNQSIRSREKAEKSRHRKEAKRIRGSSCTLPPPSSVNSLYTWVITYTADVVTQHGASCSSKVTAAVLRRGSSKGRGVRRHNDCLQNATTVHQRVFVHIHLSQLLTLLGPHARPWGQST